jgi:hypothetical protein
VITVAKGHEADAMKKIKSTLAKAEKKEPKGGDVKETPKMQKLEKMFGTEKHKGETKKASGKKPVKGKK